MLIFLCSYLITSLSSSLENRKMLQPLEKGSWSSSHSASDIELPQVRCMKFLYCCFLYNVSCNRMVVDDTHMPIYWSREIISFTNLPYSELGIFTHGLHKLGKVAHDFLIGKIDKQKLLVAWKFSVIQIEKMKEEMKGFDLLSLELIREKGVIDETVLIYDILQLLQVLLIDAFVEFLDCIWWGNFSCIWVWCPC